MVISSWNPQDKVYICLPLERNIPNPRNNLKLVQCPECGENCWESDIARQVLKHGNIKGLCTQCAIRKGVNKKCMKK